MTEPFGHGLVIQSQPAAHAVTPFKYLILLRFSQGASRHSHKRIKCCIRLMCVATLGTVISVMRPPTSASDETDSRLTSQSSARSLRVIEAALIQFKTCSPALGKCGRSAHTLGVAPEWDTLQHLVPERTAQQSPLEIRSVATLELLR
jgi:hypothetical protein